MNRAWIALAGLAAVGAAALALDLRDHAAGKMSAAECASREAQLASAGEAASVSVEFARDISRLTGQCAARDVEGAIHGIEAALRADLDESAILLYADALLNIGQGKRAAPWIRSAVAIALTSRGELAGPFGESDFYAPWLIRAVDRTAAALNSGNARRIAAELEAYFVRPPRARHAELRLARIGVERLERADARESLYWRGRLEEWTVANWPGSPTRLFSYLDAIRCGDRRAMRRLAALYLAGKADETRGQVAYYGLVLLADSTAEERALTAALEPQFGRAPLDMSDPLMREARAEAHQFGCEIALRFVENRQR
jgi:hypothetical protein